MPTGEAGEKRMADTRANRWPVLPIADWLPQYKRGWLGFDLVAGVTLAGLAVGDPARQAALASLTALIVAGVFALAWLLRLSVLVNFISESVLTGFKAGAALVIASTQLPKLFGVKGGGDDFFERMARLVQQLPGTNLVALAIGGGAIAALVLGEKL